MGVGVSFASFSSVSIFYPTECRVSTLLHEFLSGVGIQIFTSFFVQGANMGTLTDFLLATRERYKNELLRDEKNELDIAHKKIIRMMENNHSYRLRLQCYRRDLQAKDAKLREKEMQLKEDEENMKEQVRKTLLRPLAEEREQIIDEVERAKIELAALRETENCIIDWVKRAERKERDLLNQALIDARKLQNSPDIKDGIDFEKYIAGLLVKNGYENVSVTQQSRDYGADVIAQKDGIHYIFQCKYYSSAVGIEAVQEVFSAKSFYKAHIAVVVTNNVFTKAAKVLAAELGVILWDCENLKNLSEEAITDGGEKDCDTKH